MNAYVKAHIERGGVDKKGTMPNQCYEVLMTIFILADRSEPITLSSIAAFLGVGSASACHAACLRLRAAGLIEYERQGRGMIWPRCRFERLEGGE